MEPDEMHRYVQEWVLTERGLRETSTVDRLTKPEMSGEAHNEFHLLLERQLMTTEIGYGGWQELDDPAVLQGVHELIQDGRRGR